MFTKGKLSRSDESSNPLKPKIVWYPQNSQWVENSIIPNRTFIFSNLFSWINV